jgi:hypothetical protein
VAALQGGSIVHWRHLNLHGEYDFSEDRLRDSVGLDLRKILALDVPYKLSQNLRPACSVS